MPLQDMRVIHVVQSCIVHLPEGAGFVALSYVWGNEPAGQFQTLRANICSLNIPGSLDNVSLPRTITDAIIVCKKLRQPYLWVDRLCIIQDESWEIKSVQLNQMGAIYRQADFTIVGLAGDGATYGLPGVSKPRLDVQKKLKTSGIEIVESTPSLATCLDQSIWQTRGWTHQESEASTAMVYFTDYGVYGRSRQGEVADVRAEGPAQISINFMDEACYLERVEAYTKRNLTYHCDILRAFTGLLYGMYGQNTVFGLPWTDFDRAILWESTDYIKGPRESDESSIFPTWSWISSFGHIHFRDATPRGCSVAYWGRVTTGSTGTELKIAVPDKTDGSMFSRNNQPFQTQTGIALAWLNGCIRTKAPKFVQADCSYWELHDRLADAWPEYTAYWQSAFSGYEKSEIFSNADIRLATSPGRIMAHTQLSAFRLDWLCEEDDSTGNRLGRNAFLLRSNNGMVAGGIYLDRDSAKTFNSSLKPEALFLVLSTSQYPGTALMSDMLGEHSAHIPLSAPILQLQPYIMFQAAQRGQASRIV
ncbi:HET-domain-containing protein [Corynespora cassiicola Philippines]|uniref:HET-domain-containing protein n=1 Tax=Corynespora cassiicola Philippines TaxID=1448308 RepID=A0A2T2NTD8_CORCC|nr:HET-domain-containing protein [Corynespora cassiicola Philippines]